MSEVKINFEISFRIMSQVVSTHKLNPNVSVDCVIFGFDSKGLKVLLIERFIDSQDQKESEIMALPGNLIQEDEDLDSAAKRVLNELTNLNNLYLEQFNTFGDPNRLNRPEDRKWLEATREIPEARVITVAYYSLVKLENYMPTASGFAKKASWVHVDDVGELAFDHNKILEKALSVLKFNLAKIPAAFELMPKKFTLTQLQLLYETILQSSLDKRNFRRKILKTGIIKPLKEKQVGVNHKPAQYYQFNKKFKPLNELLD